jgi:hypothetical protein
MLKCTPALDVMLNNQKEMICDWLNYELSSEADSGKVKVPGTLLSHLCLLNSISLSEIKIIKSS